MAEMIPTFAGRATRGETFAKLLHHIREAGGLCAVLSHLHNTEDTPHDKFAAKTWLLAEKMMAHMERQLIELSKGTWRQ